MLPDDFPLPRFHSGQRLALREPLTNGRIVGMEIGRHQWRLSNRLWVRYQVEWPALPEVVTWWPEEYLIAQEEADGAGPG